ncbi:MAG TPA: DUF362 domain-containing protein [Bacteroidota bacterium]|nr:DUF362 domain-containing protein [Bacteroidota bacterium]
MRNDEIPDSDRVSSSRRDFIKTLGTAAAGLIAAPWLRPSGVFAYTRGLSTSYLATVAMTNTTNTPADSYVYDDAAGGVKQKVEYLIGLLDGSGQVSSLFAKGKKVVIKINLTGGSGSIGNALLNGVPITEAQWTHPAVVRAVAQLILDAGVSAGDLTIVESLGSPDAFTKSPFQDYLAIQTALGCNLVDISTGNFVNISTGTGYFNYASLTMNQILKDADVYVSIPKLKQHAEAGLTCSLKNQVGTVPQALYETTAIQYRRQALHSPTNGSSASFLPRSICDLNAARPVHLAVVDGIRNARGGEGVWISTFVPTQSHVLVAGLNPVATDSVAASVLGLDCQATKLPLPLKSSYGDTQCDNYLDLLNTKGVGTNQLNQIQIVGDGAPLSVAPASPVHPPSDFQLSGNFPNPFNPSTMIVFYVPREARVTLAIYDMAGRAVETLVDGEVPPGEHRLQWSAQGLASGVYLCRMTAVGSSRTIKLLYEK